MLKLATREVLQAVAAMAARVVHREARWVQAAQPQVAIWLASSIREAARQAVAMLHPAMDFRATVSWYARRVLVIVNVL